MIDLPQIVCQRGCSEHVSRAVTVDLAGPHGYADLSAIPASLARQFGMQVWDPSRHPVDNGPYCPARDAVSQTIIEQRIWEPVETILTLLALESDEPGLMVDIGCQIGWFSLLALSCGRMVWANDADPAPLRLLGESARANGWTDLKMELARIEPGTPLPTVLRYQRIRLAKIDIEGAEPEAIEMLWPSIAGGLVDHLLMEVSPVFHGRYPALVERLISAGYACFKLPGKSRPPVTVASFAALERIDQHADLASEVASWHQENLWFKRLGASW